MTSLLVELLTEELPPKALKRLGEAFAASIAQGLQTRGLTPAAAPATAFATPRRLAVRVSGVLTQGKDAPVEQKLMPLAVARGADGKASVALRKKLAAIGRADLADAFPDATGGTDALLVKNDGKSESVYLRTLALGQPLARALEESLHEAVAALPIPKVMSYQLDDGATTVQFVRPAHGLVALHGANIVDVSVLGLKSGRTTRGHRFQGAREISIATADAYDEALAAHGQVIAAFDARRAEIERQLLAQAGQLGALLGPELDVAPLLDEVTALVEYPSVYVGAFASEFLSVPQECLILTMRQNQKYFPLFDASGKLTNRFLIVSNMRLADPSNIVEGNQRVVAPRLEDARFFFSQDRKLRLEDRVPQLARVVYHNKLGSQLERVERVQLLAGKVARAIGADTAAAERAAWLAKADLVTNMVGEFPELQGVMGRYYASADGEGPVVAEAIEQHYRPRHAGDALPDGRVAQALALADKLETLAGMFGIGQQPSGDKDPFALRRHALGVVRILIEAGLEASIADLIEAALGVLPQGAPAGVQASLEDFIFERLRGYLREAGYSANECESVLCMRPARLDQVPLQLAAVRAFAALPEAASLAAANKRVANILKQAEAKGETYATVRADALRDNAERELQVALARASQVASPLMLSGDYTGYLKAYAVLKAPVDAFFEAVMVMAEDPELRRNRLALLSELRAAMNRFADLSKLAA